MQLSARRNWILSGVVGLLLVANGLVRVPGAETLTLVIAGALVAGGLLAGANAVRALRDPSSAEGVEWTTRKTTINLVALAFLVLVFLVSAYELVATGSG